MLKYSLRASKLAMASACAVLTTGFLVGFGYSPATAATHLESRVTFRKLNPAHVLPADLAAAYSNSPIPITQSAYAHWKAEKGPYVVGFANSNMGNTWRAQSLANLKTEFNLLKKKGIVSKLIVDNANNDVTTQISQIQDMIAEHVNLILINAASETALNPVIEKAYKAGIVVVGFNNIVSSPYAENRDINQGRFGSIMAQGLVNILHGKGNIVMIEGIPGAAGSTIRENAALAVFKKYPNIHIVANVSGEWTETGAKTAMLQVLATHPETINGVWGQGGMTEGIEEALRQAGRPMVPITITGMENAIDFVHSQPKSYNTVGTTDPPVGSAVALRVGVRILEGEHPKLNAVFNSPPAYNKAQLLKFWNPKANPDSWIDPPVYQYVPSKVLNQYFSNGKAIS